MNLMSRLPDYYLNSSEVITLQKAIEKEGNLSQSAVEDLLLQLFVDTATWGLTSWEKVYGIKTDITKDYDLRRSRIKSKMRGTGTTTVEMIKNVAESFVNGLVEIVEHNEQYKFDIKMMSVIGIPPNMEDLKDAIEELKPAHLAYEIILKYNTWSMASKFKWGDLANRTWGQVREEAL